MYNTLKKHNGQVYTGMKIGASHYWNYSDSKWYEIKKAPDRWQIKFNAIKTRAHSAPMNTGAGIKTQFHWYIIADQIATKLDANSYMTSMKGVKFKVGHKRPYWRTFSYEYPNQIGYKERIINILEDAIRRLKAEKGYYPLPYNI
ncbi:MAG: hypothetical protein EU529_07430 [Promethearchaeota archaeon]|nr:MAG: hypothetical protein EU529_07430 [Candidatus Lokiarchaeota archaeon]